MSAPNKYYPTPNNNKDIVTLSKEAKEFGLNYGDYVAMGYAPNPHTPHIPHYAPKKKKKEKSSSEQSELSLFK